MSPNLHEISKPIFWGKYKKYLKMLSAEIFLRKIRFGSCELDDSQEISSLIFSENAKKKKIKMPSAAVVSWVNPSHAE